MTQDSPCLPFLRWPGGKRWAAPRIAELVNEALSENGTYYEPFLGSGAVFFHKCFKKAVLSDVNEELIVTYQTIKDEVDVIIEKLRQLPVSEEDYYRIRQTLSATAVDRSARFLYLNRTAFAGIYRVNSRGEFNVPYGGGNRTPDFLYKSGILKSASTVLQKADLRVCDFETVMREAKSGDVVYCDPTYTVAHDTNGFIRYNERNFSWADQVRLANVAKHATQNGATVLVSNAHHFSLATLYSETDINVLTRKSLVSPNPEKRREISEYLFIMRPTHQVRCQQGVSHTGS